ncbi:LCP family protein [Curtobacterium sp. MCBD17_021]|uniref:LCP family protein n=1 Tax=Curtobacterium sp. MCBD17_021 TaxID=2175665 RepID=UPI0011B6A4F5|nr:LCP family protein [Curtobacterium sp. MCBD17_021]
MTAIAAGSLSDSVQSVHIGPAGKPATTGAEALKGAVNFVMVGSDTRQGQSEAAQGDPGTLNNDVTMLVHISADHQQMTAVSIPRDTVVPLPACVDTDTGQTLPATRGMFNTALSRGGAQGGLNCVVAAVANITGVEAEFAGIFKFDGVAAMSAAVGGVDVCIASPIHDPYVGLDLEPGTRTIEVQQASAFLRSRHGIATGSDLGRISNQQVFLSALARKMLAPGGALSNPVTMYKLAHAALSNMIVSDNLKNVDTMVSLALTLKGMDLSKILFVQYPTVENPADPNRLIVDQDPAHALNVAIQTDAKTNLDASALGAGATTDTSSDEPAPSAPTPEQPAPEPEPPSTTSSSAPEPSSSTDKSTSLPSSITGQNASENTCSKGAG